MRKAKRLPSATHACNPQPLPPIVLFAQVEEVVKRWLAGANVVDTQENEDYDDADDDSQKVDLKSVVRSKILTNMRKAVMGQGGGSAKATPGSPNPKPRADTALHGSLAGDQDAEIVLMARKPR